MAEKKILLGNEAIARGAYEAGVKVSSAYPGTPSTEVRESLANYEEVYAEWAPKEKVATVVAIIWGMDTFNILKIVAVLLIFTGVLLVNRSKARLPEDN